MNLSDYFDDTVRSIAFLSRIPVPTSYFSGGSHSLSRSVQGFPAAGALILAAPAILFWLLLSVNASPLLAAFLTLILQVMITGALHEDGLGDTADGLFGGQTKERILEIMKDSRVGAYGVIALVLTLGLRTAALAALAGRIAPIEAALCLPAVAAMSRGLMVWHWSALPPAKTSGVAASQGSPDGDALRIAIVSAALISLALIVPAAGPTAFIVSVLVATVAAAAFSAFVRGKIGGHTGDTIGATQQISECLALASLALIA